MAWQIIGLVVSIVIWWFIVRMPYTSPRMLKIDIVLCTIFGATAVVNAIYSVASNNLPTAIFEAVRAGFFAWCVYVLIKKLPPRKRKPRTSTSKVRALNGKLVVVPNGTR